MRHIAVRCRNLAKRAGFVPMQISLELAIRKIKLTIKCRALATLDVIELGHGQNLPKPKRTVPRSQHVLNFEVKT